MEKNEERICSIETQVAELRVELRWIKWMLFLMDPQALVQYASMIP